MEKIFRSFLALLTISSFSACNITNDKIESKTADEFLHNQKTKVKENIPKKNTPKKNIPKNGTFKIGIIGRFNNTQPGFFIKRTTSKYTQNIDDSSTNSTGEEYFKLPSGLNLIRSTSRWEKHSGDLNQLFDENMLASYNLDSLFIDVQNGVNNSSDVYNSVVERKIFNDANLFFIGQNAKSIFNNSSKTFAGGNISTATFNEYAAAYIGGFQAAVGAIKFSGSEGKYEKTDIAFLIGSIAESKYIKKAFAFRRGVEAAAAHPEYSEYLNVKFVNKSNENAAIRKLYWDVDDWKSKDGDNDESKPRLYRFTSTDTFNDADRRIIYIAGTNARDWRGMQKTPHSDNTFKLGDDTGLIGAMYNYSKLTSTEQTYAQLTSKSYPRGIWIILDEIFERSNLTNPVNSNKPINLLTYNTPNSAVTKNFIDRFPKKTQHFNDYLTYDSSMQGTIKFQYISGWFDGFDDNVGLLRFERHDIKIYGSLGKEIPNNLDTHWTKYSGTENYVKTILKAQYMGGPNYMIGKHTIYGAPLFLIFVTKSNGTIDVFNRPANPTDYISIWAYTDKDNDSLAKVKARFWKSYDYAVEKELIEDELVKPAPWIK